MFLQTMVERCSLVFSTTPGLGSGGAETLSDLSKVTHDYSKHLMLVYPEGCLFC